MTRRIVRLRSAAAVATAVLLLAVTLRFVTEAFAVPSSSMEPTLLPGDHILVTKLFSGEPDRGDVLVFSSTTGEGTMIKRVIGLPGESVQLSNGRVLVNGVTLPELYLAPAAEGVDSVHIVPRGHFFMLGDNRGHSEDSRVFGFVRRNAVVGRARIVYWSVERSADGSKVRWNRLFNVIE